MGSMLENIVANAWIALLVFRNFIHDKFSGSNELMIQYVVIILILGSMAYASYIYRKRWNELKINRPDLFMLIEERKKAMQESRGKK